MKAGAIVALIIGLLVAVDSASANVRLASPSGTPSAACSPAPCDLQTAVESAAGGDEVVVLPGVYVEADQLDVSASLFIHGAADRPPPVVVSTAATGIRVTDAGYLVRRLALVHFGAGDAFVLGGGVAEQLVVRTEGSGYACRTRGGSLRDSICWSRGAGGLAAGTMVPGTFEFAALRNVSAIASGVGGIGLHVEASAGGITEVTGYNVIADGAGTDIVAQTDSGGAIASIDIRYSNFATRSLAGTGTFAPTPGVGFNQTDPPVFADALAGDFHQHPDSPTIERGSGEGGISDADVDGEARLQGYGIDIGADEFAPGPPPPDVNPPDTKILKGPPERTKRHSAQLKFGTTEPANGVLMCSLDNGPYRICESPKRVKVGGGPHYFRVFAIDAAGNADPTPAARSWRVKRDKKKGNKGHGGGGGGGHGGGGGGGHGGGGNGHGGGHK